MRTKMDAKERREGASERVHKLINIFYGIFPCLFAGVYVQSVAWIVVMFLSICLDFVAFFLLFHSSVIFIVEKKNWYEINDFYFSFTHEQNDIFRWLFVKLIFRGLNF